MKHSDLNWFWQERTVVDQAQLGIVLIGSRMIEATLSEKRSVVIAEGVFKVISLAKAPKG
jgi:hypothetical protein